MTVTLTATFSSAHFYQQPLWSKEKNQQEFGLCFTDFGHGHNYKLLVHFKNLDSPLKTQPDNLQTSVSSHCISSQIEQLQSLIQNTVKILDHQHLNMVLSEFQPQAGGQIPTTENIATFILQKLNSNLKINADLSKFWHIQGLRLYEMDDLWIDLMNL